MFVIKFSHEYSNSLHQTIPFLDVQVRNRSPYKAHRQASVPPQNIVPPTLSLTNEAENSLNTLSNVVIAAPHYKGMRIAFAQFHVTKPFNRKKRNPPRLTEHPLAHPSTLRYLKYHLLSTSIPLCFDPPPTAKRPSLTHQL